MTLALWMIGFAVAAFIIVAVAIEIVPAGRWKFRSPGEDSYHGNTTVDIE